MFKRNLFDEIKDVQKKPIFSWIWLISSAVVHQAESVGTL